MKSMWMGCPAMTCAGSASSVMTRQQPASVGADRVAQFCRRAVQPRLDRPGRHVERLRQFGLRQIEEEAQHEQALIVRLEPADRAPHAPPALAPNYLCFDRR